MKILKTSIGLLLISIISFKSGLQAQTRTHVDDIIRLTISKVRRINDNDKVVEKSFSDIIYPDTSHTNRTYKNYFVKSNVYHLNVYASGEDVSDINIIIFNNQGTIIARDNLTSNDVSLTFRPSISAMYYIVVTGTLLTNVPNAFFNLIIDRD